MEYITVKEAAQKWKIGIRVVQDYCKENRIYGTMKYGNAWMIPADAVKPCDPRKKETETFFQYHDGNQAVERTQKLKMAELDYYRGNPEPAKALWREYTGAGITTAIAAAIAVAASISSGDYEMYYRLQEDLEELEKKTLEAEAQLLLQLPQTLAAVSMSIPAMTPEWLKKCDFTQFPEDIRPFLLYLYVLHLRNIGESKAMLYTAQTVLALYGEKLDAWIKISFHILCTVACCRMSDYTVAREHLEKALPLGISDNIIMPFADNLGEFGNLLEECIGNQHPEFLQRIQKQWEKSFKNWMHFHNAFSRDYVTTLLSLREYQIARLLVSGMTYAKIAETMKLSVGRVKNITSEIYGKLYIKKREELKAFLP